LPLILRKREDERKFLKVRETEKKGRELRASAGVLMEKQRRRKR